MNKPKVAFTFQSTFVDQSVNDMADGAFVAYYRVSTAKQGVSGLGLNAQKETVHQYLNGGDWRLVGEYTEIETGTAKGVRPQLDAALARCRVMGATLVVANVSRLTRNPDFIGPLVAAGVDVHFCDMPNVEGAIGRFMLRQMLAVAELEAGMISDRTRKALAAKAKWYAERTDEQRAELKAEGKATQLGGFRANSKLSDEQRQAGRKTIAARTAARGADLAGTVSELRAKGVTSASGLAAAFTAAGIPTARGGTTWTAVQVQRLLAHMA